MLTMSEQELVNEHLALHHKNWTGTSDNSYWTGKHVTAIK